MNLKAGLPDPPPIFINYQMEQGLANNWVKSILQDHDGYLWFLTAEGLHKFNGTKFSIYKYEASNPQSLPANNCKSLLVDKNNVIWVGHHFGISRLDPVTDKFVNFTYAANNRESLPSNDVISLSNAPDGMIWIGTVEEGLAILDPETMVIRRFSDVYPGLSDFKINTLKVTKADRKRRIWLGSGTDGLKMLDLDTKKIRKFETPEIPSNNIITIYEDDKGGIWLGTLHGGLLEYDEAKQTFVKHLWKGNKSLIESIHSITSDKNGKLWLACENQGLQVYDPITHELKDMEYKKYEPNGVSHNSIQVVFRDRQHDMWLGTFVGGLSYYKFPNNKFGHYFHIQDDSRSLLENSTICFLEDYKGAFWVGTDHGGITRYNPDKSISYIGTYKKADIKLPGDVIIKLYESQDRKVWIGSYYHGFQIYDQESGTLESYENIQLDNGKTISGYTAAAFTEDRSGAVWIGTWGNGIIRYDRVTKKFTQFNRVSTQGNLPGDFIFSLFTDRDGIVWVSCSSGFVKLVPESEHFKMFVSESNNSKSISGLVVFHAMEDSKGYIWVTTDMGLNRYDKKDNTFKRYQEPTAFPNNNCFNVQQDRKGKLWISSSNGLIYFDPESEKYQVFVQSDGIQARQFAINAGYTLRDGRLAYGGLKGFNLFDPATINMFSVAPPVFCYLKRNAEFVKLQHDSTVQVDYAHRNLDFSFLDIDFNMDKANRYSFMLEGFDKGWRNSINDGLATYTNLDAGSYMFKLKVYFPTINTTKEFSFPVIIGKPFWQKWYFKILLFAFIIWCLYQLNKLRNRYYENQKQQLELKIEKRTAEITLQKEKIESLLMQIEESLDVAQNIQQSLLPSEKKIKESFSDHFVIYRPLAKVSGDFYWMYKKGDKILIALVDCTGHGVPGAILAMMANDKLNEIARGFAFVSASGFLNILQNEYGELLRSESNALSGMDISLCVIDPVKSELQFAGAKASVFHVAGEQLKVYKGARFPIGYYEGIVNDFGTVTTTYKKGDMLYLFSDGVIDQMGGESNSKFLTSRLSAMIKEMNGKPCEQQQEFASQVLKNWMGDQQQQLDDISLIGIRL